MKQLLGVMMVIFFGIAMIGCKDDLKPMRQALEDAGWVEDEIFYSLETEEELYTYNPFSTEMVYEYIHIESNLSQTYQIEINFSTGTYEIAENIRTTLDGFQRNTYEGNIYDDETCMVRETHDVDTCFPAIMLNIFETYESILASIGQTYEDIRVETTEITTE